MSINVILLMISQSPPVDMLSLLAAKEPPQKDVRHACQEEKKKKRIQASNVNVWKCEISKSVTTPLWLLHGRRTLASPRSELCSSWRKIFAVKRSGVSALASLRRPLEEKF